MCNGLSSLLSIALLGFLAAPSTAGAEETDRQPKLGVTTKFSSESSGNLLWRSQRACGANCAYLFIKYFRQKVDYSVLASELLRGDLPSLLDLKNAISSRGINTTIVKGDRQCFASLDKPVIAHLESVSGRGDNSGHFVLVLRVDDVKGVYYIDGTTAMPHTVPWREFERDWSGHLLAPASRTTSSLALGAVAGGLGLVAGAALERLLRNRGIGFYINRFIANGRFLATIALFVAMAAFPWPPCILAAELPTLETISKAHRARFDGIRTLRADYRAESTSIVGPERLYEIRGTYELPPFDLSAAYADDGRVYQYTRSRRRDAGSINNWLNNHGKRRIQSLEDRPSFADVKMAMKEVPPELHETLKVFDGKTLIEKGPYPMSPLGIERTTYSVVDISELQFPFFMPSPLEFDLWAPRLSGLPHDDEMRRAHRIPDLLESGRYSIAPKLELIGDDECVVVSSPDDQTLWLLPRKGFAPRKRTLRANGWLVLEYEFRDHARLENGEWLSGTIIQNNYAQKVPGASDRLKGLLLTRKTWRLTKLEVNAPSTDALFHVDPRPGDLVSDENLAADKGDGEVAMPDSIRKSSPAVSYIVPANPEDLDRVVAKAVAEDRRHRGLSNWLSSPLLWANVALVATIATFIAIRRFRRS